MEQRRRSPATDEQVRLVRNTLRDLGRVTNEMAALQTVKYDNIVVLEFIGDHTQEKRVKLVRDRHQKTPEGVDILVDDTSPVGQKILGQPLDGKEIFINDHTSVKILEIIDPEISESSEPH